MPRIYQILLPLLSLFLVRVDLTDLFPLSMRVKLLKVYDGDTLLVRKGSYQMRLRLTKIDAPEMGQPFLARGREKDAGTYSKECLESFLHKGGEYELTIEKYDIYGRVLGDLDGLTLRLVQKGCVTLYPYSKFKNEREKFLYLQALKKAKSQRSGLWDFGGYKQPMLWRKFKKRIEHQRLRRQDL